MQFYSADELSVSSRKILENLARDEEAVITRNGVPSAILISIKDGDLELTMAAIRQARAVQQFKASQRQDEKECPFTDEEIEAEIQAVRRERESRQSGASSSGR